MTRILILKTGALGDVLRTTSVLPGLHARYPGADVTWVTAPAAWPLVGRHPLVREVRCVDPRDADAVAALAGPLGGVVWDRLFSLDDEEPLCALASALEAREVSGAYLCADGTRAYTRDVAPWFDMGLLSVHGKARADELKIENQRSHPALFAQMLGVEPGRPELPLPDAELAFAAEFAARTGLRERGRVVGLNTGAGGRWQTKEMPLDEVLELARELHAACDGEVTFLVLGGPDEAPRNARILAGLAALAPPVAAIDARTDNGLERFAALIGLCDLLVVSDSLALHVALARRVPVVAFFAPTSAAEIELYGAGEKVLSTAPDYCSYRRDADNCSITAARVGAAARRVLGLD
jgi:heptosyltransferase-2